MHDVTRGAATRLSTSTFDIRGSLVKAFVRCLASFTGEHMDMQSFSFSFSFSPVSSFSRRLPLLPVFSCASLVPDQLSPFQLLSLFCFSNCVLRKFQQKNVSRFLDIYCIIFSLVISQLLAILGNLVSTG